MKPHHLLIIACITLLTLPACKKHDTPNSPPEPYVAYELDSTVDISTNAILLSNGIQASGALFAKKITLSFPDSNGNISTTTVTPIIAYFTSNNNIYYTPAGDVLVNNIPCTQSDKLYNSIHPGATFYNLYNAWNENGNNIWQVTGNDTIPAFTYTMPGAYPDFDDSYFPQNISHDSALHITFNSSNTTNADYAFVVVNDGNIGEYPVVSAHNGSITIPQNVINGFITNPLSSHHPHIDVVVYSITTQTFGGKKFAFIKQRSFIKELHVY